MSYGNRGYVAAAGFGLAIILLAAGATLHSALSNPQQQQSEYRGQAEIERRYTDAVAANADSPAYAAYPKPNSNDCYKVQNHDSADLCAQWRAAIAAERAASSSWWAVFWAIVGTILSGAGLIALLTALNQTERSLREARNANEIADKTAKAELRAYVTAVEADYHPVPATHGAIRPYIVWKNGGHTPARRVIFGIAWKEMNAGIPADFTFPITSLRGEGPIALGPSEQVVNESDSIVPQDVLIRLQRKATRVFLWGWIEYSDIFWRSVRDDRRRSEFAAELFVDTVRGKWELSVERLWRHNGMDGDCLKVAGGEKDLKN